MTKTKSRAGKKPDGFDTWTQEEQEKWLKKVKKRAPSADSTLAQLQKFDRWLDSEIEKQNNKAKAKQQRENTKKTIEKKLSQIAGAPYVLKKRK